MNAPHHYSSNSNIRKVKIHLHCYLSLLTSLIISRMQLRSHEFLYIPCKQASPKSMLVELNWYIWLLVIEHNILLGRTGPKFSQAKSSLISEKILGRSISVTLVKHFKYST